MSGNNYTCRDKYYNYGSYLRSRGYDKEICNLVVDIEAGNINIGPIEPGSCSSGDPTIINNSVVINPCENDIDNSTGTLLINGGNDDHPSLVASQGAHINGDVIIRGNLAVTGYLEDVSSVSIYESLEIDTYPGYEGDSFAIYQSQTNTSGNIQTIWIDSSLNTSGINDWEEYLAFSIDGPGASDGATNQSGHARMLKGATLCNPPLSNTPIDIEYNKDLVGTDVALDVYGGIYISDGNNGAKALIDISGGKFSIYEGNDEVVYFDNIGNGTISGEFVAEDLSINRFASIYDLSVVNLMTVGTSTTYINTSEISANEIRVDDLVVQNTFSVDTFNANDISANDISTNDISVNNINIYDHFLVSKNMVFDGSIPHSILFNTGVSSAGSIWNNGELDIRSTHGPMVIASAGDLYLESTQSIDISANAIDISANSIDISANAISMNINPLVQFPGSSDPFTLFGVAKTLMNMIPISPNMGNGYGVNTTLLNASTSGCFTNYPSKTFTDTSSNIITSSSFFNNCIIEITVSLDCNFSANADGMRCVIINNGTTLRIDTRSIAKNTDERIVFGPTSFYTTPYVGEIDTSKNLTIQLERVGLTGTITNINNVRLVMNTTKYA